ncbi:MAG: hypothetical protein H7X84_12665, partial [Verrucomicrobia bacterium]|nr:hypothetical protein [Prolixibacteraceae bacterium]
MASQVSISGWLLLGLILLMLALIGAVIYLSLRLRKSAAGSLGMESRYQEM